MDDNQDNSGQDSGQTGENQSAADSTPSYVTADQLDAFSKDLMGNLRKTMAGMLKTQQQPAPERSAPAPQSAQQPDYREILAAERATDRLLQRHGLTERQSDMARQLLEVNKPEDANAFIASFAKDVGAVAQGSSQPEPQTKAAPNPNPTSDRGSPSMTPSLESDDVPVWKWSEEKTAKFIKEKGYREFAQTMKQRLQKDLHGIRFKL